MNQREYRKYHGQHVEADWERVQILRRICNEIKGVKTVSPRRMDLKKGSIDYDFVDLPCNIGQCIPKEYVFANLGRLLAMMQGKRVSVDQKLFRKEPYPLSDWGLQEEDIEILEHKIPAGWLHCDFWHGNVFWDPEQGFLILDPLPGRSTLRQGYIRGCGAIDLACMHMGLLLCHPLHKQLRLNSNLHLRMGKVFIDAYLNEIGASTPQVSRAMLRLSYLIGLKFMGGYAQRLAWPLALIKQRAAARILQRNDWWK